jgi:hypothetical protein
MLFHKDFQNVGECKTWLEKTFPSIVDTDFPSIAAQIFNGRMEALTVDECNFVCRIDGDENGDPSELMIVLAEGKGLLRAFPAIKDAAQMLGIKRFFCHVKRAGMAKICRRYGAVKHTEVYLLEV